MEVENVGSRIRELRKNCNMTQDDLAMLLGVSRVQVNQWETGAREISAARIVKIAEQFHTTCDYLLRGIDPMCGKEELPAKESTAADEKLTENQLSPTLWMLSPNSVDALNDVMHLDKRKRDQYVKIINGLLGSESFWQILMPTAYEAYKLCNSRWHIPDEKLAGELSASVELLKFGNSIGYTDNLLIEKEKAYEYQLIESAKAFWHIIRAIIEKDAHADEEKFKWILPYRSSLDRSTEN